MSRTRRRCRLRNRPRSLARARLRRKTAWIRSCRISCARKCCSVLWAKGTASTSTPKGHLPTQVQARPRLRFGIAHLVVGLQPQRRGQQTGRHRGAPVVETVEGGEILIPEQLVPGLAQLPMETVPAHQLLEVVFGIEQASLRRPFAQQALRSLMALP